jgi:hypothetical protein
VGGGFADGGMGDWAGEGCCADGTDGTDGNDGESPLFWPPPPLLLLLEPSLSSLSKTTKPKMRPIVTNIKMQQTITAQIPNRFFRLLSSSSC